MKIACLFFVCFLAVALAEKQAETTTYVPHTDDDIKKATVECKKEMGIVEPNEYPDGIREDQLPCFFFCAFEKIRVMNENATVNMAIVDFIYKSSRENQIMRKNLENCEKLVDSCQVAQCVQTVSLKEPNLDE